MIPKIIHYCWFGRGPMDERSLHCIESWKTFLPDYEIKLWDEDSFDVESVPFVKEAYECKKYAFVSDYVRIHALYKYGGIYFDTDLEVLKDLDPIMKRDFVAGFESIDRIATCLLMARRHSPIMKKMLDYYEDRHFKKKGRLDMTTNVEILTRLLTRFGVVLNGEEQEIQSHGEHVRICKITDFCPYSMGDQIQESYPDSYAVHWCQGSWVSGKTLVRHNVIKGLKKVIGDGNYRKVLDSIKNRRLRKKTPQA